MVEQQIIFFPKSRRRTNVSKTDDGGLEAYSKCFSLPSEDRETFENMVHDLMTELDPAGTFEDHLVYSIAKILMKKIRVDLWEQHQSTSAQTMNIENTAEAVKVQGALDRQLFATRNYLEQLQKKRYGAM